MSERYAYRAPSDPLPRAITNGGQNVINLGGCPQVSRGMGMMMPEVPVRLFARPVIGLPAQISQRGPSAPGATSTVPQPPPIEGPAGGTVMWGTISPALGPMPAPTVGVSPTQTSPSLTQPGTTLDSSGSSAITVPSPASIEGWLSESTLISGFANWEVAGAGLLAAWLLLGKRGRR